ncbi:MAG: O-antigen ligase family protein [Chloroflexi bacterium]|nr:O-antigen ligase family protein [Chloroflexota bacterium]
MIALRRFRNRPLLAWNGPLVTLLGLAAALAAGLLLIRLTPLGGVLVVGLAVIGVATVIEPLAGLAAALFLGPLWAYLRAEVPQVPAQIAQFFVALALAAWLARGLVRRNLNIPHLPLLLPLSIFVGAALLSLWDAVELPVYGVPELIKWVQIVLLFLFVSDYLSAGKQTRPTSRCMETRPTSLSAGKQTRPTSRRLHWLLGALLVTGLFQAGVGVWQFGLRGDGPDHFAILGGDFYRAYGTFEQPNPYAGYVGMTLALAIGVTIGALGDAETRRHGDTETRGRLVSLSPCLPVTLSPRHLVLLLTVVTLGAALAMSWSRGAWLGCGAALAVMALALPRQAHWGLLLVAVLIVGAFGLYATGLLPPSILARLTGFAQDVRFEDVRGVGINDANYAIIERLAHWQAALEMLRYNFWTGVGFGCYEPAYSRFALINWPIALGHAHNFYLNIAAETGLIGLVAYLILWGAVFWQTWRATRRAEGLLRGVAIGLLGTWTHLSVHHLLDNLYVNNVHLHIGAMLGLLAFIIRQTDKQTDQLADQL